MGAEARVNRTTLADRVNSALSRSNAIVGVIEELVDKHTGLTEQIDVQTAAHAAVHADLDTAIDTQRTDIAEVRTDLEQLRQNASSTLTDHLRRIVALEQRLTKLVDHADRVSRLTFLQRLRWLVTGRVVTVPPNPEMAETLARLHARATAKAASPQQESRA